MAIITKPLLAGTLKEEDFEKVKFPVYASTKLDGIRALMVDNELVSRKFKLIPNKHIRKKLEAVLPEGIDGEILANSNNFQDTTSMTMNHDRVCDDFTYYAFDYVKDDLKKPYLERMGDLQRWYDSLDASIKGFVRLCMPVKINNEEQLLKVEKHYLEKGFEGVMLRKGDGEYKCGRSSLNQGILLKLKRFQDSEAEILDFVEQMHNLNEAKKDAFGRTERSSSQEGKVPAGTLGNVLVRDIHTGIEFSVGSGFDDAMRAEIWNNQGKYKGALIKYKSFLIGAKEAPRFPVFIGFRDPIDM